jgi:hypothetical protein
MPRVALALAALIALASPGSAPAATWSAPHVLSADGAGSSGSPTTPAVAVDGTGAAVAGWTPVADTVVKLRRAATTPALGRWTALKGSVSANREGAVAATATERLEAWADVTDTYTSETTVLARLVGAAGKSEKPRELANQRGLLALRATGGPDGRFAIAWVEKGKTVDAIVLWVRGTGGAWAKVDVPAPAGFAHASDLAVASGGKGAIAIGVAGNDRVIHAAVRSGAGTWTAWQALSKSVSSGPRLASARPEGFLVAWSRIVTSTRLAVEAAPLGATSSSPAPERTASRRCGPRPRQRHGAVASCSRRGSRAGDGRRRARSRPTRRSGCRARASPRCPAAGSWRRGSAGAGRPGRCRARHASPPSRGARRGGCRHPARARSAAWRSPAAAGSRTPCGTRSSRGHGRGPCRPRASGPDREFPIRGPRAGTFLRS